ncbi:MAG: hypothetical protein L6Q35_00580 [Phycisphaerales bacterium]|nr:hypothetical protein [Phycisphaerales bacterium]
MDANTLLKKYCIDEDHLPNQAGMNVVQIRAIDTEYYEAIENRRKVEKERHLLWLSGFDLPLRLNNTRLKILIALLGSETDHWVGKKIGLFVGASQNYGEVERCLMIHIQPIDQSIPPVGQVRRSQLQGGQQWPPQQAAPPAAAALPAKPDTAPIGADTAAEICAALEERNKSWDDLRLHLATAGFGELIAGKLPPDCPAAILPAARTYVRDLPRSKPKPDPAKFKQMWAPPPEVVDRQTGEVINPAAGLKPAGAAPAKPEDDIPF